ncbi:UDP-phosphate galactose phosphotransferase, partial [Klebsiella pneumoniae]
IWASIWIVTFILLPTLRMTTKRLLDIVGLWRRETWILGSGKNAVEAFNAVSSERNLGLSVIGFIAGEANSQQVSAIAGIPVINPDAEWLALQDKKTQFIVAVETNQADLRNAWLRNFMIKGYRYVSVIPTLRGMPLDSTDMSFIFSHEVMIFRVQQNLAKVSSRVLKRIF